MLKVETSQSDSKVVTGHPTLGWRSTWTDSWWSSRWVGLDRKLR